MSNCIYGYKVIVAFELAKGYVPSIYVNPSRLIPENILIAHKQQEATRALNRMLRTRERKILSANDIKRGDKVLYYYNSSKGN